MPETVDGVDLPTLQKMLGVYCSETGGKNGNLSTKRTYCKELHDLMLKKCGTREKIEQWLKDIIYKSEGLGVVIDEYLRRSGKRNEVFETFTYKEKTFDVRDIIQAIEDSSKLLLCESEVERINVNVLIKKAYGDP